MNKKILVGIALVGVVAVSSYLFLYKEHRDIKTETADYVVSIPNMDVEFQANDSVANAKYSDKTIELVDVVTSVDEANNGIVLGEKVFGTFAEKTSLKDLTGKTITVKGRFLGYDELVEEYKLDQISIIK
ncbi:hypothetical protein L1S34_00210 [Flavobacterium sp. K77]|uniref:OB-fold protein n=1 Tax=Flavobacterium sp. K77 TaxID=2910676 RepID=UPI001F207C95|nr:hypothetical protein [Flavobacterium sp. K77]MCF6139699.1 hypothetical protein [Flavobacterium sp. K77]